jgi:hypothetical protein
LTRNELRELFPDGEIHCEKLFGLTKSFMVVRRSPVGAAADSSRPPSDPGNPG